MKSHITKPRLMVFLLIIYAGNYSCKELDNPIEIVTPGEVLLDKSITALYQYLGIKCNGKIVDYPVSGIVRGIAGDFKLEFYNIQTGQSLGEKTINFKPADPDQYMLFQVDSTDQITFFDKNAQAGEATPPTGYMKIKLANLCKKTFPEDKIDVVVYSTTVSLTKFDPVDTIRNVGRSIETAPYYLVRRGVRNGSYQTRYRFSFMNANTKQDYPNSGGTKFLNSIDFGSGSGLKGIYTIYFRDYDRAANAVYLLRDGKYYDVQPNVLFKN